MRYADTVYVGFQALVPRDGDDALGSWLVGAGPMPWGAWWPVWLGGLAFAVLGYWLLVRKS